MALGLRVGSQDPVEILGRPTQTVSALVTSAFNMILKSTKAVPNLGNLPSNQCIFFLSPLLAQQNLNYM